MSQANRVIGAKRVLLREEPFVDPTKIVHVRGTWPASWVYHPSVVAYKPVVMAFRCRFKLLSSTRFQIHVSADERYELFLNGERLGRGPERGDRENWYFESYELELSEGEHMLVARTWWLGPYGPSPHAQISVRPAFLMAAEGVPSNLLDTGVAPWECLPLGGYEFVSPAMSWGTGARLFIHGADFSWGIERGQGDGWQPVENVSWRASGETWPATSADHAVSCPDIWKLRPAMLPILSERLVPPGVVREGDDAERWNELLCGRSTLRIPPNSTRRVVIDLEDYYCAYPEVVLSGGKGAILRVLWAESLYENVANRIKGNRNEVLGKQFIGTGDIFEADGGTHRKFETLWWEAGRYLEVVVATQSEPLTIECFHLHETHYPYRWLGEFDCSDARLAQVIPIARRTLEMCSHETYMDCPYYEQNQYVVDTRLDALAVYALTGDDCLPRKAIQIFGASRLSSGLTRAQYPSRWLQIIPPFSLWWVAMVHDFAMWRDDIDFVCDRMLGVRAVLDAFRRWINADDLLESPNGWNFVDWVPAWKSGVPPGGENGISAVLNWHLVYTLRLAAELEEFFDEPELAARNRKLADRITVAVNSVFWDERRGLFADDLAKQHFSEHTQCLSILAGGISDKQATALLEDPNLTRGTIYFTHYLFEAYHQLSVGERIFERLNIWFNLAQQGFKTTPERPEPTRSDCHGWGAHPLYHYIATILGIRPAAMGFKSVRIAPQLGPLAFVSGKLMHPCGFIEAHFGVEDERLTGHVTLPEGVSGSLSWQQVQKDLRPGKNEL